MPKNNASESTGWESRVVLNCGTSMPLIGMGTQYGFSGDGHDRGRSGSGAEYVALGLSAGFRLVDTARGYDSEAHVMRGIEMCGIDREEVFVVSKAWPGRDHEVGFESSRAAIAESASRLGGYVDLFLVHQPVVGWEDLWRALEEAKHDGVVRAIGVSNFNPDHLEKLDTFARLPAVANQIHLHPFVYGARADTVQYCQEHDIKVIAYPRSPWKKGEGTAVDSVAESCGRTRAQVILRWAVDHGFAIIPLSTDERHLKENFAVTEFQLTPEQLEELDALGVPKSLRYSIDHINADFVDGWVFDDHGVAGIQVLVDGESVGNATYGLNRVDVQEAFPEAPGALESGFEFRFPGGSFKRNPSEVALAVELRSGKRIETEPRTVTYAPTASSGAPTDAVLPGVPFPTEALQLLRDLRGSEFQEDGDWSDEQVRSAVDDLILVVKRGPRPGGGGLFRYLSYLGLVLSHATSVERHFPRFSPAAGDGDKDSNTTAPSPHEMLCVAHHLYVLKSRGLSGRLVELGCFDGFSTSCLSFACHELGIGFDVFDSGEVDRAGSLEEVKRNVRDFGRIDNVEFHRGRFSETLPKTTLDPLCIWMNTDLDSRDVMSILPALTRESCIFSREGTETVAAAFAELDRPSRGRHLHGSTGAVWEDGVAIPVLPFDQLLRLLELS